MNPYDMAYELAKSLKKADIFTYTKSTRDKIMQDESTLRMIQSFRAQQWQLEAKRMMGQELSTEEQENLEKLASVIELHQDIREYLQGEYQLSVLFSDIQKILADTIQESMLPEPIGEE